MTKVPQMRNRISTQRTYSVESFQDTEGVTTIHTGKAGAQEGNEQRTFLPARIARAWFILLFKVAK